MNTVDLNWLYLENSTELYCNGSVVTVLYSDMQYHEI